MRWGRDLAVNLSRCRQSLVAAASNESEKLNDLMTDLIEVAELDTGKRELNLERLRPLPLLNEARDRYCEEASEKHIRVEVNAYADSVVCAGRPARRSFDSRQPAVECASLYAGGWRDSAGCRRDQELRAVHRARYRAAALKPSGWAHSLIGSMLSRIPGPGLAWRWCGGWWSRWAGRLPWRAAWATERRFASRSRSPLSKTVHHPVEVG